MATPTDNTEASNSVKSNSEELGNLVNMPYESDDVVWKQDSAGKRLVAVLLLSPADSARLIADAEKIKPGQPATVSTETWFPAELIAKGGLSGDDDLKGIAYSASDFLRDPYKNGRITRIEGTDYFIMEVDQGSQ
ncbi:MAG: hypothetical protein ACR2IH_06935 [Pyrinomonadaceae bacterium]